MDEITTKLHGRQRTRANRRRGGFTLIELLLVLVILAVLIGVVATRFTGRTEQARDTAARTDINALETALQAYEIDNGRPPSTEEGLGALVNQPASARNWKGPYIKRGMPSDPWGNPYVYRFPGSNNENGFDLSSLGPDGREGGDDVNNWDPQ